MKDTLEGINSRLDETGYLTSELRNRVTGDTQREHENENRIKRNKESLIFHAHGN